MPKALYEKKYFVRWDNAAVGGRWFESDIVKLQSGSYSVTAWDSDKDVFDAMQISYLGLKSKVGDVVLSYYGKTPKYAHKGIHEQTSGNKIFVRYDDGDTAWEDVSGVHKLVPIDKNDG